MVDEMTAGSFPGSTDLCFLVVGVTGEFTGEVEVYARVVVAAALNGDGGGVGDAAGATFLRILNVGRGRPW